MLDEFRAPFNGKLGPVPVWRSKPVLQTITPSLPFLLAEAPRAGVTFDQGVISAAERAGELTSSSAFAPVPCRPTLRRGQSTTPTS